MIQINNRFLFSCKQAINSYNKALTQSAQEYGLSKAEADVLLFLGNNPEYDTAKDVVDLRGFSKAYVSKAVEQLVEKQLIEVFVEKGDRRYQHLKIKENAKDILIKLRQMQIEFYEILGRGITDEDMKVFFAVCDRFAENAKEIHEF